jgi:hypothetical protein
MTSRAAGGCGFPVHQLPFTGMGVVVSLVSVIANAPAFTATGVAVSEGLVAYSVSSSLVVTAMFVLGGVVGGGIVGGGVDDIDPPPELSSCPPQAARTAVIAAATPMATVVRFMVFAYQSLALVGDPASGVLRYGKAIR